LYILFRALGSHNLLAIDVVAFVLVLAIWLFVRRRDRQANFFAYGDLELPPWLRRFLYAGFTLAICGALYSAIRRAMALPNGEGWDSFAIWNLHARFLFRSGTTWQEGFSPLIPWSHPDYPLLLPAAIAHFWTYLGHESQAVPSIIGLVFTLCTAGVLFSALMILRGRYLAMLGCMALLATPLFVEQGTSQYADVPLSFFLLATVALVCLRDLRMNASSSAGLMVLAGVACSFAAWTKNEGLLFLFALLVARFVVLVRDRTRRSEGEARSRTSFAPLLLSVLPLLLVIIWFKHFIAPPGDLFTNGATTIHKLINPSRYWPVFKWYGRQFFRFGHWLWAPGTVLVSFLYFATRTSDLAGGLAARPQDSRQDAGATERGGPEREAGFQACVLALLLTLAGYFFIYVITPYDVYWHLRFSLNRLFLQVWPSAIFLCLLRIAADPARPRELTTQNEP
jgi:hypothetical protein